MPNFFLSSMPASITRGVQLFLASLFLVWSLPAFAQGAANPQFSTISNGTIDVGVDVNGGGSIGYLAPSQTQGNVVNVHDFGRCIGQSYYSGPEPFGNPTPTYANWPWNPVSAGDFFGNASQIIALQNNGSSIYVKSIPKQWALNNVPSECTFETWISFPSSNVVQVINRLVNARSDANQYSAYNQELPAMYTTGRLFQLFAYTGNQPFTGGALTQIQSSGGSWSNFSATEEWAALVDNTGWGLGVYAPGKQTFLGGFAANGWQPGTGGPLDPPTGYIAPIGREIIDHNIVYTYQYYLVLGTLTDIRNFVYSNQQPLQPNYVFSADRQHCYYLNATDSGWPIQGHLHVNLNQPGAQIVTSTSPFLATQAPVLLLNAAYHLSSVNQPIKGQVALRYLGSSSFAPPISYNVITDGQYHVYQINLPAQQGVVTDISLMPVAGSATSATDSIDIVSITSQNSAPGPAPPIVPPFGHHAGHPIHYPFHFHHPMHFQQHPIHWHKLPEK